MRFVVLFIAIVVAEGAFSFGMNDTSSLFKDKKGPTKDVNYEGGALTGKVLNIGQRTLTPLIPVSGQNVPSKQKYQNGKLQVLGVTMKGHPGVDKQNYYEVRIITPSGALPGTFLIPEAALNGLTSFNAAAFANKFINTIGTNLLDQVKCNSGNMERPPEPKFTLKQEKEKREELQKRRRERRESLPEEGFSSGISNSSSSINYDYSGDAPIAGGVATAVAGSDGLVLRREDDPNAGNGTEGCAFLAGADENSEVAADLPEPSKEDYKTCITNIHKRMLQSVPPPLNEEKRKAFFGELFELPNHEQEFAAAIFTLKGEMEPNNPGDGVMILKVLQNRRDNQNGIEDEVRACEANNSSPSEIQTCIGEANKDSVYNLLDIAVHRARVDGKLSPYGQFSMYNEVSKGGNWAQKLGNTNASFDQQLDAFLSYGDGEISVSGSDGNQNEIYHYANLADSDSSWYRGKTKRSVTVIIDGQSYTTKAHTVYQNIDGPRDGFTVPVDHEWREF